ncbi:hypothetical protein T439DRAFT_337824 [Meredithblackwellia eburnea MCA 4105]
METCSLTRQQYSQDSLRPATLLSSLHANMTTYVRPQYQCATEVEETKKLSLNSTSNKESPVPNMPGSNTHHPTPHLLSNIHLHLSIPTPWSNMTFLPLSLKESIIDPKLTQFQPTKIKIPVAPPLASTSALPLDEEDPLLQSGSDSESL